MAVLLAIDLGTEGARVGAFDADGRPLATAHSGYRTTYPRPGWAEQDPREWWAATVTATREVLANDTTIAAGRVEGIAAATTASTVAVLDANARPARPALLWMDARASAEAEATGGFAPTHPVLRWSGGVDAVEWLVPKAMWLASHEPEIYRQSHRIVEALDYLTYRLTGTWVASRMNATCKWNYDPLTGCLPEKLYADLGVPDLATKLPSDIRPVGSPAGQLGDEAARELGITGRPVVATGGIDAHISLLGCGAPSPGLVSVVAGTSTVFVTETPEPIHTPTIWGPYPHALRDGQWLIEGGQVSSGSVLRWMAEDVLGRPRSGLAALVADARAVVPADHGLLMLDYFMGNRTPHRDARLRGTILGLTLASTPAQLYRAAVEAVAYGTRSVLDSFVDAGIPVDRVVLSGGIRHNPLWLAITSEVLERRLEVVESDNLTLRAGAVAASAAAGWHPNLETAAKAFGSPTRTVDHTGAHATAYREGYARYRAATELLRPVLHELSDIAGRP